MKKWRCLLLLLLGTWLSGWWQPAQQVQAQSTKPVLLVYDSQNTAQQGEIKIDSLQRLLTSLNLPVKTVASRNYRAGMLNSKDYQGEITLINWSAAPLGNPAFERDRATFKGIRLHIGQGLSASEAQAMKARRANIYHQQLTVENHAHGLKQLLPFSETLTSLTGLPKTAQHFGQLITQSATQHIRPYGTIVDNQGYLPYFVNGGLSYLLAAQTMAHLFHRSGHYQPLLTITNVTPYTDIDLLNQLSSWLYRQGIPFAISTTTVGENTQMDAYQRFTRALQNIENRGGVVFLQTPVVGSPGPDSGQELNQLMVSQLTAFGQRQVFPVGISAAGFWNQDRVYRSNSLAKADHALMLPDPATVHYARRDNASRTFKLAWTGISESSLATVKNGPALTDQALSFPNPTAVLLGMPDSKKGLLDWQRRVKQLKVTWYNPALAGLKTKIDTGSATFAYQAGSYYLNGTYTVVPTYVPPKKRAKVLKKPTDFLNLYFRIQGDFLYLFFGIALIILLIFMYFGRRIYRQMFRRK